MRGAVIAPNPFASIRATCDDFTDVVWILLPVAGPRHRVQLEETSGVRMYGDVRGCTG